MKNSLTQAQISRSVGVTRSAISRMLTEAREKGIVDIRIRRPLRYDAALGAALMQHFGLRSAYVVSWKNTAHDDDLRDRLGHAAAQVLATMLTPGATVGVAWGTTVSATIDAFDLPDPVPVTVVQLVGVLGSSSHAYNAQALVERLARKTGGEGVYLYTPFIVENADTARSLLAMPNVQQAIETGRHASIALLGIGSTQPELCEPVPGRAHLARKSARAVRRRGRRRRERPSL